VTGGSTAAVVGPGALIGYAGPVKPEAEVAAVDLRAARLCYGARTIWDGLDLTVRAGEFLAVLGPNGSGKSSLLRVLLGQQQLSAGRVLIAGAAPRRGSRRIGFVPQHAPASANVRARDLVRLGVDGHLWGAFSHARTTRRVVDELLAAVGATPYADVPLRFLSGGERQRLRVAQALAGRPAVLLCDEPLASLDAEYQQSVTALIDAQRRSLGAAVVFVTHEVNPVLPYLDRVLYLGPGGHRIGSPEEVLTSGTLTELHDRPVLVLRNEHGVAIFGTHMAGSDHFDGTPC